MTMNDNEKGGFTRPRNEDKPNIVYRIIYNI